MKKLFTLIFIAFIGLSLNAQVENYSVGDIVDDFTVTDVNGVEHNLYAYADAGKVIYIKFFYYDCSYCQATAPTFNEFYDKYGCNSGDLICLAMNSGSDDDETVIAFEENFGGSFNHSPAISADGGAGAVRSDFGISYFPTICVIGSDRKMKVVDIWPVSGVETFEANFPSGFSPSPMECTTLADMAVTNNSKTSIYPNPAGDLCYITYNFDSDKSYSVSIINVLGQEVYSASNSVIGNTGIQLNADSFDKGIYIVRLLEDGKTVADMKLNVQ